LRLSDDENAECGDLLAYPELLLSITRSPFSQPQSPVRLFIHAGNNISRNLPHSAEHLLIMPVEDDSTRRPTAVCFVVQYDSDSAKA
jgi:hypothetical protein